MHEMQLVILNCIKQKKTIQQLMRQNRHLKKRVEILHTQWFKKAVRLNKTVTYLIVNVTSSAQVNTLIDERLLFQCKLKHCELYHENCHLMQCFKCQKYRHTAWICCQNQKCDLCVTSEHDDHSCAFWNDSSRHQCVNCEESHSAWFFRCKMKQKQIEKAWLIYSIRSCKYADVSQTVCESLFQTFSSQLSVTESCAVLITEFIFAQLNTTDSEVLMNCFQQQQWQIMLFDKHRRTDSRSAESTQTSQSINKSVRILIKSKISQSHKKSDWFHILSQTATDDLNIAEFFIQNMNL